jgi:hypothetical protein
MQFRQHQIHDHASASALIVEHVAWLSIAVEDSMLM